jgi:hypothetical protein
VAKPLIDLQAAIDGLYHGMTVDERQRHTGLLCARFVAALSAFVQDPQAMLPAQRALMVMPGRPSHEVAHQDLRRALQRVDKRLGPQRGGFSRLLDDVLANEAAHDQMRLRAISVDLAYRAHATHVENVAQMLVSLDDISHAFSMPADLAAGAIVLEGLLDLIEATPSALPPSSAEQLLADWIHARGLAVPLIHLMALRGLIPFLHASEVEAVASVGLAQPLALWMLAVRLTRGALHPPDEDPAALDELLRAAGLHPLEVQDVAMLFSDDDDDDDDDDKAR